MGDYTPLYQPGQSPVYTASAAITGGKLLMVSGSGTVAEATALATNVVGVAAQDYANGDRVTIRCGGVQRVPAVAAGVTAGDIVTAGAAGCVQTIGANAFGTRIGIALTTAASAVLCEVLMDR